MIKVMRFTAPWCAPCKMITPIFKQLQEEMPAVTFETVDVDASPDLATQYKVRSVPTIIIFKNDIDVVSLTGANSKAGYTELINDVINGKFDK